MIAKLIDYALFLISIYVYIIYFGQDNSEGGKTISGLMALSISITWIIYFIVIEVYYNATLAHQGLYLKILIIGRKKLINGQRQLLLSIKMQNNI